MAGAHFETTLYPRPLARINKPSTYHLHLHRHIEFICVTSGKMELRLGNEKYTLKKDDAALIVPYTLHNYFPLSDATARFVLVLEPETVGLFGDILLHHRPERPVIPAAEMANAFPALSQTLHSLITDSYAKDVPNTLHGFAHTVAFLDTVIQLTGMKKAVPNKNNLFLRAVKLCNERYQESTFGLRTIAQELHVSESHIKQLFAKNRQMSVKKYLTMLRMGQAEILLAQDDLSISHIAEIAGFGSVRTFNRLFREQKGVTPFAYKEALQNKETQL